MMSAVVVDQDPHRNGTPNGQSDVLPFRTATDRAPSILDEENQGTGSFP